MERKEYVIGGKRFFQKELVWGQVKQVLTEIKGVDLPSSTTTKDVLKIFEDKLPRLVAIVLEQEGVSLKEKNIDDLVYFFEWELSTKLIEEIVEDFFGFNPILSWSEKMQKGIGEGTRSFEKYLGTEIGSTETSPLSAEETSQSER